MSRKKVGDLVSDFFVEKKSGDLVSDKSYDKSNDLSYDKSYDKIDLMEFGL